MEIDERNDLSGERLPPGRHGLSRDAVASHQRERLHAALTSLVAEGGYASTTVQMVSRRAGVSKASFYQHFDNFEHCFWSANDLHIRAVTVAVNDAYEAAGPAWPDRIRAGLRSLLEYLSDNETFARVLFIEALGVGEGGLVRRHSALATLRSYFDPDTRPEMEIDVERPELAAEAVVDSLAGMLYTRVLDGRTAQLREMVDDFFYVAMLPYGGSHRAAAPAEEAEGA